MESQLIIAESSDTTLHCKPIDISDCVTGLTVGSTFLKQMEPVSNISSYIGTLVVLAEAVKRAIVVHRIHDPQDKVIVGGIAVSYTNTGLRTLIEMRNNLIHATSCERLACSIQDWYNESITRKGLRQPIPAELRLHVERFYDIDVFKMLGSVYERCIKTASECGGMESKLEWCRGNAPDALKDVSDSVLLDNMSSSYANYSKHIFYMALQDNFL